MVGRCCSLLPIDLDVVRRAADGDDVELAVGDLLSAKLEMGL
jgi:hypothetical protein